MLNNLFTLIRPLFVVDTETTGTDTQKDRIVELGFQRWDASGMTKEWRSLINPGMSIPESATKIHGIDDSRMKRCNVCDCYDDDVAPDRCRCERFRPIPYFRDLAANLAGGLVNCDFAGKNVRFDLRILSASFARASVAWSYQGARIIDAERLEQLVAPRTLSHLHYKYTGQEHEHAHGALSDAQASTRVIMAQLEAYVSLPRDLDALHALQWPGWIDSEGKFRFDVDGVPRFGPWGKYAGQPMRSVDAGYWDWMLKGDFSAEMKALAADAKLHKFPTQKVTA